VTQGENKTKRGSWSVAEGEEEVARAKLAFDQGLREVSRAGTRAARRVSVPVAWGVALFGGTLALLALARMVRRRSSPQLVIRVSVEPNPGKSTLPIWSAAPMLGSALARLALRRLTADAPGSRRLPSGAALVRKLAGMGHNNGSAANGQRDPLV
jgi:hypothetical protein